MKTAPPMKSCLLKKPHFKIKLVWGEWYFPSHIVLTKCLENFAECNLRFFLGIEIEKMAAEVLSEVKFEAGGQDRDLRMVQGCIFFNQDTQEKSQNTQGIIFKTQRGE